MFVATAEIEFAAAARATATMFIVPLTIEETAATAVEGIVVAAFWGVATAPPASTEESPLVTAPVPVTEVWVTEIFFLPALNPLSSPYRDTARSGSPGRP